MRELWYRQPAKEWEEALPLGNGRLGAMVFGRIESERVQVNEESIWYGGMKERVNPDAKENLPEVRRLIREGHISKAQKLMETTMTGCPQSQNPYQILGNVNIYFDHQGVKLEDAESPVLARAMVDPLQAQYRRSLSLSEGVCRVEYRLDGTEYRREYFISHPEDCMVMRFSASESGKISFTLRLDRWYFFKGVRKTYSQSGAEGKAGEVEGQAGGADGKADGADRTANGVMMYGRPGEDGNAFVMMAKGRVKGGSLKVIGESLIVENADEAMLVFGAITTYRYPEKDYEGLEKLLGERLERTLTKDYGELLAEHVMDHGSLFDRVELKLGAAGQTESVENVNKAVSAGLIEGELLERTENAGVEESRVAEGSPIRLPIDERLKLVREGAVDLGLEEFLFDYGRYLMIAGSREGTLPTTLQGLWNQEYMPPWESKYTININTEMNYWPAETCNLSECHLPLFELVKKMVPNGRKVAREMYGCRGFMAHHNTDIHGDCAPQDLWIPATYWPMGAAWLCTHLWTHYEYTLDLAFLKEAFPVMAEAALYFVDALQPWGEYYVTNPSSSPENTYILPSGDKGCVCMGPTMDNQILRDLFTICLDSYEILTGRRIAAGMKGTAEVTADAGMKGTAGMTADAGMKGTAGMTADAGMKGTAGMTADAGMKGTAAGMRETADVTAAAGMKETVGVTVAADLKGTAGVTVTADLKGTAGVTVAADLKKAAGVAAVADEGKDAGWSIRSCHIPDCDDIDSLMREIADRLSKLVPTKIGGDGRIMEWLEEYEEEEPGHRHVSQLYGLYPSNQITMDGTPELAAAARKTLEARLKSGGGHTGWSRAWIMNHYAKLWDGEEAHANILKMLAQSTYPNLFDKHPPFQIDGNFGATAAIAQMLLQSGNGRVILLPALPKAWKDGEVRGLRIVGNASVDLAWKDGGLVRAQIKCLGKKLEAGVQYGKNSFQISLAEGEIWSFCC